MSGRERRALFVCTGNTCRSPMAQFLLLDLARRAGLPWTADSAGLGPASGEPLSPDAEAELARRGVPTRPHKARRADADAVEAADVIYAMTPWHRARLAELFPPAAAKTFVLREAAGLSPKDVPDPVGRGAAAYRAAADAILEALEILVRRPSYAD